jgi:hypothetical protein
LVIDSEGCSQPGPAVTVSQPDTLIAQVLDKQDITNAQDGLLVVGAQGGTAPYTYTLLPTGTLQGFGTFTFDTAQAGEYVVEINDARLCGPVVTDTIEILDLTTTGIEYAGSMEPRVFPNPATDIVTVEIEIADEEVVMEVMSLTGQVVYSREVYTSGGMLRETIEVSEFAEGMYMLRLNGRTVNTRIVVN